MKHKYYAFEEYDLSIEIYNKLISLNDKVTNLFKPITLMQIGTISNKHGKHEKALDHFEAAWEKFQLLFNSKFFDDGCEFKHIMNNYCNCFRQYWFILSIFKRNRFCFRSLKEIITN